MVVTGVDFGDFIGDLLDGVLGDFLAGVDFALFTGDSLLGLSSVIVDSFLKIASDFLFNNDFGDKTLNGSDNLLGVVPFLTGVIGGSFLSNISGLNDGPNEILFFLASGPILLEDFLLLPLFTFGDAAGLSVINGCDLLLTSDNSVLRSSVGG